MPTFDSFTVNKGIRHRGLYQGKEQSVSGHYRVADGGSIATVDLLRMIILGENIRPEAILVGYTKISGNPVVTNPSFSVGVAPLLTTSVTRADGTTYPPLTAGTATLGASTALGADGLARFPEPNFPAAGVSDWGPYYVTLTPSGAGAFAVAGGAVDVFVEVVFRGELHESAPLYTTFNSQKYAN